MKIINYFILLFLINIDIYASTQKWFKDTFLVDILSHQKSFKPKCLASKNISVEEKKRRFKALLVPAVQKVYQELMQNYRKVAQNIEEKRDINSTEALKIKYGATSDSDLLARLKPHPVSIVLAQAALESSWATSRFFLQANNPFGMWSTNPKEPRIAATVKRGGTRTIWLKKFTTLDDAIRAYYETIARARAYKKFRTLRMLSNNPYKSTEGLDKYSEMGEAYTKELNKVIRYNNFTLYDTIQLPSTEKK